MRWIILTGLPATGKSTLARQLAARCRLPLLAKDDFKERLLDAAGPVNAVRSRELSDQSFAQLFTQLHTLAERHMDAVLEGNFRAGLHETPLQAPPGQTVQVAQILCRCEEQQRLARIAARRNDPARHPGHADADSRRDASNDQWLELPGERWLFDTSARGVNTADLLQQVERWLGSPISRAAP
jgi:predicted kinase